MEDELIKYSQEILGIKKYLIKKGKSRYSGNIITNKLSETESIFKKCESIKFFFNEQKDIKPEKLENILSIWNNIKKCYTDILVLCEPPKQTNSESDYSDSSENPNTNMEFDLKTACNLIPVMDSNENHIKSMIDSIEMYADMLSAAGKKLLITFVLKSRLSENAKLRMSAEYTSTCDLVKDLRKTLLPKKSFTAIQSRLQNISQGWRTIDQYGTEIEKLFSELTISQADGNSANYAVLKPINEKMAVKRFSEGLRDQRLSTIIAARNYENLKDAIQAAKDEEISARSAPAGEGVMQFSRRGRGGKFQNNFNNRQFNNRSRGHQGHFRHNIASGNNLARGNYSYRGNRHFSFHSNRGRSTRAPNNTRSTYHSRGNGNQRVFYTEPDTQINNNKPEPSNSDENQFFRS